MNNIKNLDWFKSEIEPLIKDCELLYKHFDSGDFGALDQVEMNTDDVGVQIDFWSLGWLGLLIWDYKEEAELINVLIEPTNDLNKQIQVDRFIEILKSKDCFK